MTTRTVLFLCPHAAAKSVLAAAEFDRLAASAGLAARGDAAGTDPDPVTNPAVVAALAVDGVDVSGRRPRRVAAAELASAWKVVSMGCDLDGIAAPGQPVLRWDDVPPVSADLPLARASIRAHVERFIADLLREDGR